MTPVEELKFDIKHQRPCFVWATTIDNHEEINSKILEFKSL